MSEPDDLDYADEVPHPRYNYRKHGNGWFSDLAKQVLVGLLIASILGLVSLGFVVNGALANLRETDVATNGALANLRLTDEFMREQVAEVKGHVDEIRGKVYRSDGSLAGDFSAEQRQP